MDGLLTVLQSLSKSSNVKAFPQFVKAYSEHQSFQLKNLSQNDGIIQHITALMSKPETRYNGYLILTSSFQQIPLDIIEQKAVLWMTLSLKACSQKGSDDIAPMGFRLIRLLVLQSPNIPDLSKALSNSIVGKFADVLEQSPPSGHIDALKCLETVIRTCPGACVAVRGKLERFILKFIDSTDENLVLWSAKCLHILQQIKGGSVEGLSAKQAWQFYQTKLVGSLHQLLEPLFAHVTEFYDDPIEKATLKLPALKLSDEPIARAHQVVTRFNNLVTFLIIALKDPYSASKPVTPRKILNLILRGLSVNCNMLAKNVITDNLAVGAVLPSLHMKLLSLLDSLNAIMGSHMLQYYKHILSIFLETLKWTETKKSSGKQKPYCQLRTAAYKSLSFWCSAMKFGSCVEVIADDLFKQIEYDITPFQNELTLQVLSGAKKHMTKKARRQLHKTQNETSNINKKHSSSQSGSKVIFTDEGNQALCTAALNCLRDILSSSSCFIKATLVKDIQDKIIFIAHALPKSYGEREKLYSNRLTRIALYDVLETLIIANNHICPPPTQLIVKFISLAVTDDPSEKLREHCQNLLKHLEKIIHPQKECLYFPPNLKEIENIFSRYGRPLGHKNIDGESSDEEEFVVNGKAKEDDVETKDSEMDDDEEKIEKEKSDDKPENNVAMEVNEASDVEHDDITENIEKDDSEGEVEIEPMRLIVESDDDGDQKPEEPIPSTSDEPLAKKIKIDESVDDIDQNKDEPVTSTSEEGTTNQITTVDPIDEEKLFEDIAADFVDELDQHKSDDEEDEDSE